MTLTVALWPSKNGLEALDLLGRPVWERTLAAARGLGAGRTLWLGDDPKPPVGVEAAVAADLSRRRDTVLLLPAELPCLTERTLGELLARGRSQPHALSSGTNGRATVVAARASDWKRAVAGQDPAALAEVVRRLSPEVLFAPDGDELLLVDSVDSWARAVSVLRSRKIEGLVRSGVVVVDPASVLVDPEVSVGSGTRLLPWVHLEGKTEIGRNAVISSFSHIVDSVIGSGTVVLDHCFIRSSRVGKSAQIGPFAHLRPSSDVGAEAKVGNFVELKNTRLGSGAKAPHLSYLGDAVIGKGSNIGAGTITCNYDGVRKHETVVGDGAFIGSDVQLVAPVKVGKGAYVAAGSCIVEDVPAYALAIARSRQTIKRGWARKKREREIKKRERSEPGREEAVAPKARNRGNFAVGRASKVPGNISYPRSSPNADDSAVLPERRARGASEPKRRASIKKGK